MAGRLLSVCLCSLLLIGGLCAAESKSKKARREAQRGVVAQRVAAERAAMSVEEKLELPARLELGDRERISLGELLDQIRERHGLIVKVDRSNIMLMAMVMEGTMVGADEFAKWRPGTGSGPGSMMPSLGLSPIGYATSSPYYYVDEVQYSSPAPCGPNGCPQPSGSPPVAVYAEQARPYETSDPSKSAVVPLDAGQPSDLSPVPVIPAEDCAPGDGDENEEADVENQPPVASEVEEPEEPGIHAVGAANAYIRRSELLTDSLRGDDLTVEDVLRAALEQIATPFDMDEEFMGLPVTYSHAYDWDLLVEGNSISITTRMHVNMHKSVRVYRIPAGLDVDATELSEVVRHAIRPWSWRSEIDELVDRVEIDWPEGANFEMPDLDGLQVDLSGEGLPITVQESGVEQYVTAEPNDATDEVEVNPKDGVLAMKGMLSLLKSSTGAAVHSMISGMQMLHYADPPTATVEVLPGMLVITQSRGAHEQIADLLEQIAEAQ